MTLAFLITSLLVVLAPGPGTLVTLAAGLSRGPRAAMLAAAGCTLGILPHMLAALTGLSALLHASALAFEAVRLAGIAWLLWMALATLRERGGLAPDPRAAAGSALAIIGHAIAVNLFNPKLSLFFLAFLPQFVDPAAPDALPRMLNLSAAFMAMTFVVFCLYGLFAAAVRDHVVGRPRVLAWLRRGFAVAFLGLGAKLALTSR